MSSTYVLQHHLTRESYLLWSSDLLDAADHFSLAGKFDISNLLPTQLVWDADHPGENRLPQIPAPLAAAAGNGAIANFKEASETYILAQNAKKAFKQAMIDSFPANEFSIPGEGYRTQEPHVLLGKALAKYGTLNATDVAKLQFELATWPSDAPFDANVTRMQNLFLQLNRVGLNVTDFEKLAAFQAITPGAAHLTTLLDRYKALNPLLADQRFEAAMTYIASQLPNMTATAAGYASNVTSKQPTYSDLATSVRELQAGMTALLLRLPPAPVSTPKQYKASPAPDPAPPPAANPNWKPPRVRLYCFHHGWNLKHAGPDCNFMQDPHHGYTHAQMNADRPETIDGVDGTE